VSAIFEVSGIEGIEPPYTAVPAIIERMEIGVTCLTGASRFAISHLTH